MRWDDLSMCTTTLACAGATAKNKTKAAANASRTPDNNFIIRPALQFCRHDSVAIAGCKGAAGVNLNPALCRTLRLREIRRLRPRGCPLQAIPCYALTIERADDTPPVSDPPPDMLCRQRRS